MKPIFPALAGLFLIGAAIPAVTSELGAVIGAGHSQSTRMQAMQDGQSRVGLSTDSHKRVLENCINTLSDPEIWAEDGVREAVLSHCEEQADRALAYAPSDSFIWWAKARLAVERSDIQTVFTDLERSRQTGPYEFWIGLRRLQISERLEILQTDEQRAQQDAELLALAQSARGVQQLVSRYLSDEPFRDRIVSLIETLPPREQRRFLNNVRAATRAQDPAG